MPSAVEMGMFLWSFVGSVRFKKLNNVGWFIVIVTSHAVTPKGSKRYITNKRNHPHSRKIKMFDDSDSLITQKHEEFCRLQ